MAAKLKTERSRILHQLHGKRAGGVPTEAQEQAVLLAWWRAYAPTQRLDARLLMASAQGAVIGGDARVRAIRIANLKRSGMVPGVPDLFLAVPSRNMHGLWIELKRRTGGTVSPAQSEMHYILRMQRYNVLVCDGADPAIRAIQFYLSDVPRPV